jgi:hypothetical protein
MQGRVAKRNKEVSGTTEIKLAQKENKNENNI